MEPRSEETLRLADQLSEKYGVPVESVSCMELDETEIKRILARVLFEFPVKEIKVDMPRWVSGLEKDHWLRSRLFSAIQESAGTIRRLREVSDAADRNGNRYEFHPDSGKKFRDFRIPEWSRIINKSMAAAATCKESNRLIGWDLAVTEDNSVDIIEGNSRPGFDILQVPDMTGRRAKYEKCVEGLIEPEELYDKETGYWRKKTTSI